MVPAQILSTTGTTNHLYREWGKRCCDVLAVVAAAPIVLPVLLILMLLVLLDGSAPLYRQKRVGKNGRIFHMWKLRSMVPDAERMLEDYLSSNASARKEWDATQKLKHDPRITRFGRFLRKSSADELPQLWNVLKGDMSLVGPRPMMVCQKELYPGSAYYSLRPGITGPWQISDRNDSEFKSRALFDTRYNQQVSLRTDFAILLRTVGVVFRGTGY